MSEISTINALRSALEPVEALRGEHSQMEHWVRESFASLELLHEELDQRQSELQNRETKLKQRESDLERQQAEDAANAADATSVVDAAADERAEQLRGELTEAQETADRLERENAQQIEALEELDRAAAEMSKELQHLRTQSEQLQRELADARENASPEVDDVANELRELRSAIEQQSQVIESMVGATPSDPADADTAGAAINESYATAAEKLAEIRRRQLERRQPDQLDSETDDGADADSK